MFTPPAADCPLCPRLVAFRAANAAQFPKFFNGAVPSFGDLEASLLVVGLAPGLKGANASGRPFTGDFAGVVLYEALAKYGFAHGQYDPARLMNRGDDGFTLAGVRITNAVRCVPPANKPTPAEERACNPFLVAEMAAMPNLRLILSLGLTSHQAVLRTLKLKAKEHKFAHGAVHTVGQGLRLLDSYHTSRYNISTGRLTQAMFDAVIEKARGLM
ncbi:MAG: uracil-DNA glycosylase [Alphaproteobacteria bacterium]|nr:uracil-DNA glycosylase [Alphaproteobacteria bacterium]